MTRTYVAAVAAGLLLAAGAAQAIGSPKGGRAATPPEPLEQRVVGLLRQYAAGDEAAKAKVIEELTQIGASVIAEVSKAILHDDRAVSEAAEAVYNAIAVVGESNRAKVRRLARDAFAAGDYVQMLRHHRRLALFAEREFGDLLWGGHAHQLAGDWPGAVADYTEALRAIEAQVNAHAIAGKKVSELVRKRLMLATRISQIQRLLIKDLRGAAATLARACGPLMSADDLAKLIADPNAERRSKPEYYGGSVYALPALEEAAVVAEQAGRISEAIDARARLVMTKRLWRPDGDTRHVDAIGRMIQRLPSAKETPSLPILTILSEQAPSKEFSIGGNGEGAFDHRVRRTYSGGNYGICPPPGKEFATLEFTCDLEEFKRDRRRRPFKCWVTAADGRPADSGQIDWPKAAKLGRRVFTVSFEAPAGAGVAYFRAGHHAGLFKVHSVTVSATFRPLSKAAAVAKRQPLIVDRLWPKGGTFTIDGKPVEQGRSRTLPAGRHVFTYKVPGRLDKFVTALDLSAEASYELFVNLDSPFKSSPTPLRKFGSDWEARPGLARLADGRWLAVWSTNEKIMLATANKDLTKWDEPRPLPTNEIFRNVSPAVLVDAKGVIHIAYFSDRLETFLPRAAHSARFTLWLVRSTDGVKWTRPRPVAVAGALGRGSNAGGVQMFRGPKGKYWLFWCNYAESAYSVDEIREIKPIFMSVPSRIHVWDPKVAVDADGKFHMAFDNFDNSVHYTTSTDGWNWSVPLILVDKAADPQLIINKGRFALIYKGRGGSFLRRGSLDKPLQLSKPVKITSHTVPLSGSRAAVTSKGEVLLLAGRDTTWLLRARLTDLTKPAEERKTGQ